MTCLYRWTRVDKLSPGREMALDKIAATKYADDVHTELRRVRQFLRSRGIMTNEYLKRFGQKYNSPNPDMTEDFLTQVYLGVCFCVASP